MQKVFFSFSTPPATASSTDGSGLSPFFFLLLSTPCRFVGGDLQTEWKEDEKVFLLFLFSLHRSRCMKGKEGRSLSPLLSCTNEKERWKSGFFFLSPANTSGGRWGKMEKKSEGKQRDFFSFFLLLTPAARRRNN